MAKAVPTICLPTDHIELGVVVACGLDRAIGQQGDMPWYVPEDLAHFKETTLNSCVVMGRRTFESIGRPLPYRRNIVISRDQSLREKGVEVASSLEHALSLAGQRDLAYKEQKSLRYAEVAEDEINIKEYSTVFIIGGARLFAEAFSHPALQRVVITELRANFPEADTFLPEFDSTNYDLIDARPSEGYYVSRGQQPEAMAQQFPDSDYTVVEYEPGRELPVHAMPFRFLSYHKKAE